MNDIKFDCIFCKNEIVSDKTLSGRIGNCPHCKAAVNIPFLGTEESEIMQCGDIEEVNLPFSEIVQPLPKQSSGADKEFIRFSCPLCTYRFVVDVTKFKECKKTNVCCPDCKIQLRFVKEYNYDEHGKKIPWAEIQSGVSGNGMFRIQTIPIAVSTGQLVQKPVLVRRMIENPEKYDQQFIQTIRNTRKDVSELFQNPEKACYVVENSEKFKEVIQWAEIFNINISQRYQQIQSQRQQQIETQLNQSKQFRRTSEIVIIVVAVLFFGGCAALCSW